IYLILQNSASWPFFSFRPQTGLDVVFMLARTVPCLRCISVFSLAFSLAAYQFCVVWIVEIVSCGEGCFTAKFLLPSCISRPSFLFKPWQVVSSNYRRRSLQHCLG